MRTVKAICKGIVTSMKGGIGGETEAIPRALSWTDRAPSVVDPGADQPSLDATAIHNLDVSVLVAEDHVVNQELLRLILESVGVRVHVVGDGAQALDAYRRVAFDMILMDVQMPVMDGLEATQQIRALEGGGSRVPIIAITANVMPHQISAYLAAGMDAHLSKPIDSGALIETIADWVERSTLQSGSAASRAA